MREPTAVAESAGLVGATVSALCCLGTPAIVSLLAAVGLGFLINDAVLVPLLLGSLLLVLWGLASGWRRHRRPTALIIGVAAAPLLFAFSVVVPSQPMAYVSIAALIGATVVNAIHTRRARRHSLHASTR
jgi:mercuric ion transport protein